MYDYFGYVEVLYMYHCINVFWDKSYIEVLFVFTANKSNEWIPMNEWMDWQINFAEINLLTVLLHTYACSIYDMFQTIQYTVRKVKKSWSITNRNNLN